MFANQSRWAWVQHLSACDSSLTVGGRGEPSELGTAYKSASVASATSHVQVPSSQILGSHRILFAKIAANAMNGGRAGEGDWFA